MNSFKEMGLNPALNTVLDTLNFTTPTPIQAQTIPAAVAGKDILGSAQTGTGKTLAFTVPLIQHLLRAPSDMALVMAPTRELAQQITTTVRQLAHKDRNLRSALLIGGDSFGKQVQQLRDARIIVGTPGRILDHLKRNTLKADRFRFLVLDETDRMFDMGFEQQIDRVIQHIPQDRQTLMFSATLPPAVIKTASRYLQNPERVAIGDISTPVAKIKQDVLFVSETEKESKLIDELTQRHADNEAIVVFVKTKWNAEKLADKLSALEHRAIALHGDLRQNKRERVVAAFRKGTYNILVATDIAARGLDIPQIRHIINFDLPQCPEDYIHRIGRTGRAGAEGFSLCLVTPKETKNWKIINKFANTTEGISDGERAALTHKRPRTGGRFGGGGRRERSFDRPQRRDRSERSFGPRKPRFSSDDSGYEKSDRSFEDRPAREKKSFGRRAFDSVKTFFGDRKKERPFFEGRSEDGGFKKRFNRDGAHSPRSFGERKERPFFERRNRDERTTEGGERRFSRNQNFDRSSEFRSERPHWKKDKDSSFGSGRSQEFGDSRKKSDWKPFPPKRKPALDGQFFEGARPFSKRKKQQDWDAGKGF